MRTEQSPVLPFYVPLGNPPSSPRGQSSHYANLPAIITGTFYLICSLVFDYLVFMLIAESDPTTDLKNCVAGHLPRWTNPNFSATVHWTVY
ncbi:MAG: hypothetical protein MJ048_04195, partial [Acidaminococcaceae bacterium]|nr:hypothetical protein [Acidaminococcaceae bacterium]